MYYMKFRYGIIKIGTISIETPNRNSQLDIYIKSLSSGYQSQLINKISFQDSIYQKIYLSLFSIFLSSLTLSLYMYIPMKEEEKQVKIDVGPMRNTSLNSHWRDLRNCGTYHNY